MAGVSLQVKEPEALVQPLGDPTVRHMVHGGHLLSRGGVFDVLDVGGSGGLEISPLPKLLLGKLPGVGTDTLALVHRLQQELAQDRALAGAPLASPD